MKTLLKFLLASLALAGLQFALSSCVTEAYVSDGVYYGPQRDPWFRDGSWMDGDRWHGERRGGAHVEVYLHPPQHRR